MKKFDNVYDLIDINDPEYNPEFNYYYELVIPNWSVNYLTNNDESDINDENLLKLNVFIANIKNTYDTTTYIFPDEDKIELGIKATNDIDNIGSVCVRLLIKSKFDIL